MSKIIVRKSPPLKGTIRVNGSKNSILPILAASLLSKDKCILNEIPDLKDVEVMCEVLTSLGADVKRKERGIIEINSYNIDNYEAPYELIRKMRASFLVLGPLLARLGRARVSMPGGCAIGSRPIDLHLKGFRALGAEIDASGGYVNAYTENLKGDTIYLDFPSVGATENIIMAASLAEGEAVIENAAEEPEIVDLANFINNMGGNVIGAGTKTIRIKGVKELHGAEHTVIPDRIEAGTYMIAAAMTNGDLRIENVLTSHIQPVIAKLREAGASIYENGDHVRVNAEKILNAVDIKTLPYPGFPTDMQAQFMALLSVSEGTSLINETIFENRFMHADELKRMGADIKIEGNSAVIKGKNKLAGAPVSATDLRAGAALILAGLMAEGETEISNIHHIQRGYAGIINKLKNVGANIELIEN